MTLDQIAELDALSRRLGQEAYLAMQAGAETPAYQEAKAAAAEAFLENGPALVAALRHCRDRERRMREIAAAYFAKDSTERDRERAVGALLALAEGE